MNGVFIHEKQKFRSRAFQRFSTWTYIFIYTHTRFSRHWIKLRRRKRFHLIYICLQKWAISFGSYYLSKIRDLRTSSESSSKILATTSAIQYKRYSRVQKLASNFEFRIIRELKHARFWDADGNRKWAVFTFNLASHNHIHIAKYFFSIRDE